MKIFSGTANESLASGIAASLGTKLGADIPIKAFADGEIGIQIQESGRGLDTYIVQPKYPPNVNDALMQQIVWSADSSYLLFSKKN